MRRRSVDQYGRTLTPQLDYGPGVAAGPLSHRDRRAVAHGVDLETAAELHSAGRAAQLAGLDGVGGAVPDPARLRAVRAVDRAAQFHAVCLGHLHRRVVDRAGLAVGRFHARGGRVGFVDESELDDRLARGSQRVAVVIHHAGDVSGGVYLYRARSCVGCRWLAGRAAP